jgi:hypothetical protein
MSAIKTDPPAKENTQGRHYTPKSALREPQVTDRIKTRHLKIASNDSQLLNLG